MKRVEEIEVFSTSFVDLLACGLGGCLVLWVLSFSNDVPATVGVKGAGPVGVVSLGVRGNDHFNSITITNNSVRCMIPTNNGDIIKCKGFDGTSDIDIRVDSDSVYKRRYAITIHKVTSTFEVLFKVTRCQSSSLHSFDYYTQTKNRSVQRTFFFQTGNKLKERKYRAANLMVKRLEYGGLSYIDNLYIEKADGKNEVEWSTSITPSSIEVLKPVEMAKPSEKIFVKIKSVLGMNK